MGPKLLQKVVFFIALWYPNLGIEAMKEMEIFYFHLNFLYVQRISNLHHKLLVNRLRAAEAKQTDIHGKVILSVFESFFVGFLRFV